MKVRCRDGYPGKLTTGRIYSAEIVIIPSNYGSGYVKFFIYDDGQDWDTYNPNSFIPVDEHNEILNVLRGNADV